MDLSTGDVLQDVADERRRQDAVWGEQNHRDGTGGYIDKGAADLSRIACKEAAAEDRMMWRYILTKGFAEAMAESDPNKLRDELVQVAAVAVAWIEHIDRRTA